MGSMSLTHWLVVLLIVLVLFGAGKIPRLMGDMAKGIKAFKSGMKDEMADKVEDQAKPADVTPAAANTATSSPPASVNQAPRRTAPAMPNRVIQRRHTTVLPR